MIRPIAAGQGGSDIGLDWKDWNWIWKRKLFLELEMFTYCINSFISLLICIYYINNVRDFGVNKFPCDMLQLKIPNSSIWDILLKYLYWNSRSILAFGYNLRVQKYKMVRLFSRYQYLLHNYSPV